jgi:hypothetical protein
MCTLVPLASFLVVLHLPDWIVPTLIGIVASFWLGMRFRSKSQMAYQSHDFTIVSQPNVPSIGPITILFNEVAVPRVVVTQLAVWNTGNTVVKGTDIVETDPLKVCFEDGAVILNAQRMSATREVNDFQIRISETNQSCASLEFDYLNAHDGAKFQIIHTGTKDKAKVTGSIRGIPKGVENWGDLQEWSEQKSRIGEFRFIAVFIAVLLLFSWIKGLIAPHYPAINKYTEWLGNVFAILAGLLIVSVVLFIIIYSLRARSRSTPKSLSRQ